MNKFDKIFEQLPDEFGREHIDAVAKSFGYEASQLRSLYKEASSKYRNMGCYWNKSLPPKKILTQRSYLGSGFRFNTKP
ncbi:hypothetical protein ACHELS_001768 [Vibrio vulnificus]|uniref:hypothetical protein n=1 Tax=Vibrio chagasii TaxID=170679 RepID=UPI0037C33B43